MNPVPPNSVLETTGTGRGAPGNGASGWNREAGTDRRASRPSPLPSVHRSRLRISVAGGQAVAEDAVLGRRGPGGERGQGARRGGGGDGGDGPLDAPAPPTEGRGQGGPVPELVPAQTVEDQQDDLAGARHSVGQPVRPASRWPRWTAGRGPARRCRPRRSRAVRDAYPPDGGWRGHRPSPPHTRWSSPGHPPRRRARRSAVSPGAGARGPPWPSGPRGAGTGRPPRSGV